MTRGQITISMLGSKILLKASTETTKSKRIFFDKLVKERTLAMLRRTSAKPRGDLG